MTDYRWLLLEAEYHRLIRDAYNEGFTEGTRDRSSYFGGKPFNGSKSQARMNDLAQRSPQGSEEANG